MATDSNDNDDGCWNCCHWDQGTQNAEFRAQDRDKGYSAGCEKLESLVSIRVGGNRASWGSEYADEFEVPPTFRCSMWEPLKEDNER